MSSTQMDLSPIVIDRKQDIASWPEGDIDQLTIRDKNRYQKRRAALIEYFQSDLPVEKLVASHRLSKADSLEVLARHCSLLHQDGRPWGFRALVPGARVTEANMPGQTSSASEDREAEAGVVSARADIFASDQDLQNQTELADEPLADNEDTAERAVVVPHKAAHTPSTPLPVVGEELRTYAPITSKAQSDFSTEPGDKETGKIVDEPEVKQEDFPGSLGSAEIEQQAFPAGAEQSEFPTLAASAKAEAILEEEEVEQEDFPGAPGSIEEQETPVEVEQEAFPSAPSSVKAEPDEEEEVKQEEFPTLIGATQTEEAPEFVPTEEDLQVELTSKLSDLRAAEQSQEDNLSGNEGQEALAVELVRTTELVPARDQQASQDEETGTEKPDGETEVAELDTVEVARVVADERLKRVVALETIKVPAALLDALEKADQEYQAKAEANTPAVLVPEETAADRAVAVIQPALPELAGAQSSVLVESDQDEEAALSTPTRETWRREDWQLSSVPGLRSPTHSLAEDSRYRVTGSQAAIKHAVRRRWDKQSRKQKHQRWTRIISAAIVVSLLVILLIPLGVGLVGYNVYTNIKNVASDGVSNLLALQAIIPQDKNNLLAALDSQKLATAQTNLQKAQSDFLQLQDLVNRPDIETLLQQFAPQYSSKLEMARRLVQVSLDVSRMGQELIGVAQMGAHIMHSSGSLLSSTSTTPLLTADNINSIEAALVHAQYYIGDIQTQMSQVNLAQLPFGSTSEKAKLARYLGQIPQALSTINQVQSLVGPVAWLLGVGQARHILVQTLDRGELRPSGGFEGQYGILTLQNGHLSPFSLRDITLLDYAENGAELGATPPAQYGWMNFGNFGVRDANLSADFPTTAKLVMNYFQSEGGGTIDGIVQITPVIIEQLLALTGPLQIKEYNETITSQNLEVKLHAYQQDQRLINLQVAKTGTDTHSTRKAFTNLVGSLLMDRIKHLSTTQMLAFSKTMLQDLQSRDLQIYLNNPIAEQWLSQNKDNGAMAKYTNGMDGFMVVQSNISISKAAQYVKSTFHDDVTLNADGSATHNLTITLNYQQTGPVYGFNTYADYVRIYAPANAHLNSAYGFNTGTTLCTPGKPTKKSGSGSGSGTSNSSGSYTDAGLVVVGCSQYYHTFTDTSARSCPDGNYQLGYDGMAARGWPVQDLGGPSSKNSDLPGYSMWAGLTLTPKNCTSTITLSWNVPHMVQNVAGQSPYQLTVGHQAGWPDQAQISIDASALKGVKSLSKEQVINADTIFSLAALPTSPARQIPGSSSTPTFTRTTQPKKP